MEHSKTRDMQELSQAELEQLATRMAAALANLQCGPDCGPVHEFIEYGAVLHQDELEWACVLHVVKRRCPG